MSAMAPFKPDYDEILEQAKSQGCRVDELLALSRDGDPFYAGMPSRVREGAWFAQIWQQLGAPYGAHLRRIHYHLISQTSPPKLPDGKPYENTNTCWIYLNGTSRNARYLGLVSPSALSDHRSAPPVLFATSRTAPTPSWEVGRLTSWAGTPSLPRIETDISWDLNLSAPEPEVYGYDYDPADQPYHLEIWVEKSTMNDVLVPVCRRLGANLVTGVGYLSITRVVEMLERVVRHGKPARIFYISDFDPAGENMPIQIARQAEFWLPDLAPDAELKLEQLVLTAQQVRQYQLPRTPIRASNIQRNGFEARHGEGAVELDALEALHPGELRRLVEQALAPYVDRDLPGRLAITRREAADAVATAWEEATEDERDELAAIEEETTVIVKPYQEELEQLAARLDAELEPLRQRLTSAWQAYTTTSVQLSVDIPERPVSELEPPDSEEDWLFSSDREYDDQNDAYQARRPGTRAVRLRITCEVCGRVVVVGRRTITTCSRVCRNRKYNQQQASKKRVPHPPRACNRCEAVYTPVRSTSRFCSDRCGQAAAQAARRQAAPLGLTAESAS